MKGTSIMSTLSSLFIHAWLLLSISMLAKTSSMDKRSTFIIHMNIAAKPKPFSNDHSWFSATLQYITDSPKFIYSYTNVINGFRAVLSSDELHALRQSPGFLSAYPDKQAALDTTHTSQFLSLNHDVGLWPASNYDEDIIIGVIDSGIWPESDSFKDKGMRDIPKKWKGKCEAGAGFNSSVCNLKLIRARYFNKGLMAATNSEISLSTNSSRDSMGHGTHTSSTAAGSEVTGASFHGYGGGIARSMAPQARLAIYKALWDNGRYASDVLATSLETRVCWASSFAKASWSCSRPASSDVPTAHGHGMREGG